MVHKAIVDVSDALPGDATGRIVQVGIDRFIIL